MARRKAWLQARAAERRMSLADLRRAVNANTTMFYGVVRGTKVSAPLEVAICKALGVTVRELQQVGK